ncbi:MAG: hypothetical protein QNM02_18780 [Acidimicrobiia bacterium]|nr:hypothetical protein [Acidimicrobiia bacterium]
MTSLAADRSLVAIVERYSAFGAHLTGSAADVATTAWLTDLFVDIGADTTRLPYRFDRFDVESTLMVDGVTVPSLPLYYSAVGEFGDVRVDVVRAPFATCGHARGLESMLAGRSRPVAVAVDGPDELVVQCNRVPTELSGAPGVIVAGNWAERLDGALLNFRAELVSGRSENLIAELGPAHASPVTITTPLTAWTPAAGERGTGLAVAIAMALDLARDHRVTFVACTGHELDHSGLRHYLSTGGLAHGRVIHLGASVAAVERSPDGVAELGAQRMALADAHHPALGALRERVESAKWTLLTPEAWPGEGGTWREAGADVLSFVGIFSLFHTAADVPSRSEDAHLTEVAASTAIDAARLFLS